MQLRDVRADGHYKQQCAGQLAQVKEKDTGVFLQGLWNFEVGNVKFRGDAGVRYVHTDQLSSGFTGGAQAVLVTSTRNYSNWLPSANAVAEFGDFVARAAVAKVVSRPTSAT